MNANKLVLPVILCISLITVSACSPFFATASTEDVQAQINTAVVATVVHYIVEATVSAHNTGSTTLISAAPPTPTPTLPPTSPPPPPTQPPPPPTYTPVPTLPPQQPAPLQVSSALPIIWAEQNTNCREGPSTAYRVVGYLMIGQKSVVHGRDYAKNWWYIENPTKENSFCWVWYASTVVEGDITNLTVVSSPELDTTVNYWYGGYCDQWGNCYNCNYNYNNYCGNYLWNNCSINCKCKLTFQNPCKKPKPPFNCNGANCWKICQICPQCCNGGSWPAFPYTVGGR